MNQVNLKEKPFYKYEGNKANNLILFNELNHY